MPTNSRERTAAAIFGCERSVVNGTAARADADGSDTTHQRLHIEVKNLAKLAVWTMFDKTRAVAHKACRKAKAYGRKPIVLMLSQNGKPGFLICVHSDEFEAVVEEWCVAQPEAVMAKFCQRVSNRRWAKREGEEEELEELEPSQS